MKWKPPMVPSKLALSSHVQCSTRTRQKRHTSAHYASTSPSPNHRRSRLSSTTGFTGPRRTALISKTARPAALCGTHCYVGSPCRIPSFRKGDVQCRQCEQSPPPYVTEHPFREIHYCKNKRKAKRSADQDLRKVIFDDSGNTSQMSGTVPLIVKS